LAIGIEHLLFIFKAAIAVTVKDVPTDVLHAEKKRPFEVRKALEHIDDLKVKNNVTTWEEAQTKERMRLMMEKSKRLGKVESDNDAEQAEESMDEEEQVM
jgi:hypothetical protein